VPKLCAVPKLGDLTVDSKFELVGNWKYIITICVPVVYMARDIMILMGEIHLRAIGRGGP